MLQMSANVCRERGQASVDADNYIRGHEALEGKTPAEVAGIEIVGTNKWLTVIQNASRQQ